MSTLRVPVLRHLTTCRARTLRVASNQRRWAQVHDVRFLATTQHRRNVLEKYRDKLDAKAREEGHADIGELKKAYEKQIQDLRTRSNVEIPDGADTTTAAASPLHPPPPQPPSPPPGTPPPNRHPSTPRTPPQTPTSSSTVKPLSAILDIPKARALPEKELTAIWRLRHAHDPQSLCATVPAHTYSAMTSLARSHPQFVLPVPHPEQGAEIHFLQWTFDAATRTSTVLFTQLAEYKARGEYAAPHTTVTHYLDFEADKGLVLMQGQVVADRGVKVDDARWLVMCLQKFYGGWHEEGDARAAERKNLLEWFGKGDTRFTVERLLEETERLA